MGNDERNKLRTLLNYWVEHNREHSQEFKEWADKAKALGEVEVAGEMLNHLRYEVEVARDGAEALQIYEKARKSRAQFDGVIMDLTIPGGMGGKEAVQKLLLIDPKARAIVSSGYSNDPIMANFREYGFSGFIAKPYRIRDLSEVLHKAIRETGE